ncbi:head GIN domain-containing protein [Hymenobacter weizhouensis]|uniref:head GIN domain-containing protein n=1 Tax=Hymenobacter sp. YIM 151500-1 TaxID=2987689 RepID=UPI002226ECBC|nr:head GIN domain-containing protein [Hymenobacter sp. YIM 151500-1]UYZ61986.1 DUF2807 domain-containing protein [Hymenobacter sp. YIM 151500-1]
MKTLRLFWPALLLCAVLLSAFRMAAVRETRSVGSFTSVGLAGSMKVVVRQGSPQKVEVEGEAEDVAHVETTVDNNRLRINTKRQNGTWGYRYKGPITVYVTLPTVRSLAVSGSGSLQAPEALQADDLDLAVSGSGSINLARVTATSISSALSGSGSIEASGAAPQHNISVSGSGGVKAPKLESKTCSISISGSGNCQVRATELLKASIMGSGNVYVSGNPQVKSSVMGSGRVRQE